jgi:gluconokinase
VILGVDVGTTGCKTVAADRAGRIVSEGQAGYPIDSPRPGWAEQDPDAVVAGVVASVRECMARAPGAPAALCLAGALHSLLAVDARDRPLGAALTWADGRSGAQAARLRARPEARALYRRTGCPAHPMYPLAKILWLRESAPELFGATARFVSVKEFVLRALTGAWLTDDSVASGSGLLDIHAHAWDDEALALAGIGRARLSPLAPTTAEAGAVRPEMARALGVPAATRVILGASDAALNNVGAGATEPGTLVAMIGSSGAVRAITPRPLLDDRERTWCYILDQTHHIVGGAINNGGLALRWFADQFVEPGTGDACDLLIDEAGRVGPGAAGLVFLPFLSGERSPGWNADARGVLFGLSLHHGRRHVARAILEAVGYRLRSVLEAVEEVAGPAAEIRAAGGFTRSALWVQILADVLGRAIGVPPTTHASALGAAFLGWRALGAFSDWREVARLAPVHHRVEPDAARHAVYARLYRVYRDLYDRLGEPFAEISRFQAADAEATR